MHRIPTLLLIAFAGLHPSVARAEEGPYSNFLIGERSLGFAGAFVAVADDPSSVFHNPAGVGKLGTGSLAGSLWAVSFSDFTVADGYTTPLGSANLSHEDVPSIPLFLGGVVKFGKRDVDRVRPHGLGVALFSPRRNDFKYLVQLDAEPPGAATASVDRLEVRHEDKSSWYGLTYAYRLRRFQTKTAWRRGQRGLSLGISTFFSTRSVRHEEVEIRAREGDLASLPPTASTARDSILKANVGHGVVRLGMLLDWNEHWRFGAMFQPPGFRIRDSSRVTELTTRVDFAGTSFDTAEVENRRANLEMPWELRLGVTWLRPPVALLTADVAVMGAQGDEDSPLPLVELQQGDPFPGVFVEERTTRNLSVRTALGFELIIDEVVPLRGGVLAEMSSSPELPDASDIYLRQDVNTLGVAFSAGIQSGGYDLSIGSTFIYGQGKAMALERTDLDTDPNYRIADVAEKTIFFFISGGRRTIGKLVREVTDDGKQKKRKKKR